MNLNILEYFSIPTKNQTHWCKQISHSDWRAAVYLHELLIQDRLQEQYGPDAKLYLLTRDRDLLAFCLLTQKDEMEDETLYPWVGFVYTFPEHRGHRHSQTLIDHACARAREQGYRRIYLTSNEIGLYEKYGFRFLENRATIWGEDTQVFFREL